MSKNLIWGVVLGAVGMLALMFFTGFAVTGSSAEARAEKRSHNAVVDQLAKICVAQFEAALAALGYSGFTVDDTYSNATESAALLEASDASRPTQTRRALY